MKNCAAFLAKLTLIIPPPEGKRHRITLDEEKGLEIGIWIDDNRRIPVFLELDDYAKSPVALAASIVRFLKVAEKEGI